MYCVHIKSSAKKPRRNHSGSTTALTTRAPTRLSLRPSRTVDRCSHHLVRPHSLQPLRGLSCTQGFKIPRQMSVSPRSMPRRRLPNDKSRAWKCPRSLTLRCAGGVATCMDEWECLDRIQARGDLHTPERSPDAALGIAAYAASEHAAWPSAPRSTPRCAARPARAAAAARTVSALKVVATDDGGSAEGGSHRLCGGGE